MAMNYDGMNGSEMDTTDSRKRPLDGDTENGVTKRSNQGGDGTSSYTMQTESEEVIVEAAQQSYAGGASSSHAISKPSYLENVGFWGGDPGEGQQASMTTAGVNPAFSSYQGENINMKILVPSIAAGAIIGKGGETIAQVQKEAGARVKMSKANDFYPVGSGPGGPKSKICDYYPGTTERVCLIMGPADSVRKVHNFIMEKIREKPDPTPKLDESKSNFERHRQVKILVPNSTAGMIIGKGGNYIKQIKEESGAYVQISQKSKETNLPERCVTIAGEMEANKKAVDLILQKIVEDPQSGSCPNISYADFSGPVASANPTGSPFANTAFMQSRSSDMGLNNNNFAGGGFSNFGFNGNSFGNQLGSAMNFNLNPGAMTAGGGMTNAAMENLKMTLRNSGFAEQATEEISLAMNTLAGYGILGMGMMGGMQQNPGNMGGGGGMGSLGLGGGGSAGMMAGTNTTSASTAGSTGFLNTSNSSSSATSLFGPVGSGSSGLGSSGSTVTNSSLFGSSSPSIPTDRYGSSPMNDSFTGTAGYPSVVPYTPGERSPSLGQNMNQNSFGLGTGMYSPTDDKSATTTKQDMEVPENIVGAILGPGGKGIVEIQQFTGTNIQISKKGIYMPGTRNRIVSITGTPSNIGRAQCVIQQRIAQEEMKRARNAQSAAR